MPDGIERRAGGSTRAAPDVLIVGGGVIGLSISVALATEGMRVRLLESESLGSGASGAAAGMLAPLSEARQDGPMLALALDGLRLMGPLCDRLKDATGIDPEFTHSGLVQVAMDEAEVRALKARLAWSSPAGGLDAQRSEPALEWISADDLRREEPDLSPMILGGLRASIECHLRPPLLVRALERCARSAGVEIESGVRVSRLRRTGQRISGVDSSQGRRDADSVVVAAGPWTPGLLEASGLDLGPAPGRSRAADASETARNGLPIEPVRGQILSLEGPLPTTREIVWAGGVYFVPKRDGRWIVGATEEYVGFDRRVTAAGVGWLLERACTVFPALDAASFGNAWAGLRPVSQDGLPFIGGVSRFPGLYLAAGHGRNGVLLSGITAERIRDELLGKRPVDPLDPFRADRLTHREFPHATPSET